MHSIIIQVEINLQYTQTKTKENNKRKTNSKKKTQKKKQAKKNSH